MSNKKTEPKLKKRYRYVLNKCTTKANKVLSNKQKISNSIRKARKIFERLHNLPKCEALSKNICDFCDLLSDYFDGKYKNLPLSTIVAVLAGILYVVLPIDALPDFLPLAGWIDDAAVLGFVALAEKNDVEEYLAWKRDQAAIISNQLPN